MKCAFAFFFIFGCEWIVGPKASKFTKETVAIQSEKKTGCDEYIQHICWGPVEPG